MGNEKVKTYASPYELEGRIPFGQAAVLGLQHVLAMFVGNLTPLLIIGGMCGLGDTGEVPEGVVRLMETVRRTKAKALHMRLTAGMGRRTADRPAIMRSISPCRTGMNRYRKNWHM